MANAALHTPARRAERTVFFARHGHRADVDSAWLESAARPFDPPLSPTGVAQARGLADRLKERTPAVVVSSPFLRTIQTAGPIADALDADVYVEPGVCEMLLADWYAERPTWFSTSELKAECPRVREEYVASVVPEYPETPPDTWERCRRVVRSLLARDDRDLVVVTHGAPLIAMVTSLVGPRAIDPEFGALFEVVLRDGGWHLVTQGDGA